MLENKHNLTVDTQSKSIGNAFVEVVQNDNVALEVQIYNNNLLVDNTAYTYTLLSVLPSKERIIRQGSIGPNGYPVFNLGIEEMSETGIILAMVQVYDELGNRVTSYDFKYRMKEDLSTGGVVPSADNPKFVIITEDSLSQTVQDAQQSKVELDEMKTDVEGVTHLTPNDRLVSDYNKINTELGKGEQFLNTNPFKIRSVLGKRNAKSESLNVDSGVNLIIDSKGSISLSVPTSIDLSKGDKYYLYVKWREGTDNNVNILRAYDGSILPNGKYLGVLYNSGLETTSYFIAPETDSITLALRNNVQGSNYYHDFSTMINLTEVFGVGSEPTEEEVYGLIKILGEWFDGEITVTQKQYVTWLLNLMRQNRNAILALGGTII